MPFGIATLVCHVANCDSPLGDGRLSKHFAVINYFKYEHFATLYMYLAKTKSKITF